MEKLVHADIVIATPGRMLDHMQRQTVDLRRVKTLVLDEADVMLDMGFIDDVKVIMNGCKSRQQLCCLVPSFKVPELQRCFWDYEHEWLELCRPEVRAVVGLLGHEKGSFRRRIQALLPWGGLVRFGLFEHQCL